MDPLRLDPAVQRRILLKIGLGFALALVAAKIVPGGGGSTPPVDTLLLSAVLIGLATTVALYAILRFDLGLPTAACLFAVGYNLLVVLVKFVLAPKGYYEVNQNVELNGPTLDEPFIAATVATTIFLLYVGVYYVVYRLFRAHVEHLLELDEPIRRPCIWLRSCSVSRTSEFRTRSGSWLRAAAAPGCSPPPYSLSSSRESTWKDFRDRRGDAMYGRPTLLLRFGKDVTCLVSLLALVAGNALLLAALRPPLAIAALLELYALAIAWMLRALRDAPEGRLEQVAIGLGARMGNGLLIAVLAWLILAARGAPLGDELVLELGLVGAFGLGFVALARRPSEVVLGYKG